MTLTTTSFSDLSLDRPMLDAVERLGYTQPTPIQEQAIPQIIAGRDVVGCAQTGTGKTAAFVLPILQRLGKGEGVRALVVTPTRELCAQIDEVARACAKLTGQHVVAVYGGVAYEPQMQKVRRGVDIVIATPGRLLDMIQRGDLTLSKVEIVVLDEADRMLDMGFWPDVQRILRKLPDKRQNLLFSATMSRGVIEAGATRCTTPSAFRSARSRCRSTRSIRPSTRSRSTRRPTCSSSSCARTSPAGADLHAHQAPRRPPRARPHPARHQGHDHALQPHAVAAPEGARRLQERQLHRAGGHRHRGPRHRRRRHLARHQLRHPPKPEDYVHRIGRTARAGASGEAVILLTADDVHELKAIERLIGTEIERRDLPGFEYEHRHIPDSKDVPKRPGKLLYRGGAQRAMQRGFRFSKRGGR